MKRIPTEFSRNGFHFLQRFREGEIAVFERTRLPHGTQKHYETVRLRPFPAREAFGKTFEAGESYPSNEQWGIYGFTYKSEKAALDKATQMIAQKP